MTGLTPEEAEGWRNVAADEQGTIFRVPVRCTVEDGTVLEPNVDYLMTGKGIRRYEPEPQRAYNAAPMSHGKPEAFGRKPIDGLEIG